MESSASGGDDRWLHCHGDVWALADDSQRENAVATIGKPGELAAASTLFSLSLFRGWQQEIAQLVASCSTPSDAQSKLLEWSRLNASDEAIGAAVYTAAMQADMGGQLFVRVIEAPETVGARALDDSRDAPFLRMPFDEAIAAFLARKLVTPEEFRALSDAARQRAFVTTSLASDAVRDRAYRELLRALEQGSTLAEFSAALASESLSLGVTPDNASVIETVFRSGVAQAYGAGRYRQITSPAVMAARPFIQYRNPLDSRTSEICAALAGKTFRQDDPSWAQFAPPNHHGCRSSIVTLRSADDAVDATSLSVRPAVGFDSAPTVTLDA